MRRQDREITDFNEIIKIIDACSCCRIGLADGKAPYIVPLNFGFSIDNNTITLYFHSASEGRKIDLLRSAGYASFEMDCEHRLNCADKACGYSFAFSSVIGSGKTEIINDKAQKQNALQIIMKHYTDKNDWEFDDKLTQRVCVFKLIVSEFACKRHQ